MKKPLLLCCILPLLLFGMNANAALIAFHYNYGVLVRNNGKNTIYVSPFGISGSKSDDMVTAGECTPGDFFGVSPFLDKPLKEVIIEWRNQKTGRKSQVKVNLNLPKAFTKKNGSRIEFTIHPDDDRVEVGYELRHSSR